MAHEKIGLNVSALGNITGPTFDIPTSTSGWLAKWIAQANTLTNGFYGLISLSIMFLFLIWKLGDKTSSIDFQFSKIRASGIAGFMCGISGIFMLSVGVFTNLYHVVIFLVIGLIASMWTFMEKK
jgi:hypothetical protein